MTSTALNPRRTGSVSFLALAAAALAGPALAAGDPFGRVIVFGDSISDSGAYADRADPGAGRFTTNPDPVWVEIVAAELGLDLTSSAVGGLNFAEGGARVAEPRPDAPGDLSRLPVTDQVDRFLADQTFRPDDLVIIQGGGNDVFHTQLNGRDFTPSDMAILDAAAGDLAATLGVLEDHGARWLVTTSVPEFEVFNAYYREAITEAGVNVLYFDSAALIGELKADPSTYGLVNVTDPACRGQAVQSFNCLPEDLVAPDANRTYLFADSVHFTGVVHEIQGQAVMATIRAAPQFAAATRLIEASAPAASAWLVPGAPDGKSFVGDISVEQARLDDVGLVGEVDAARIRLGIRHGGSAYAFAAGLSLSDADADLGSGASADWSGVGLHGVVERRAGDTRIRLEGGWSQLDDVAFERRFDVGPATRVEQGTTSGEAASAGLVVSHTLHAGALRLEPSLGLRWSRVALDGFDEAGAASTSVTVSDQRREATEVGLGLKASWPGRADGWRPYVGLELFETVSLEDSGLSVTPSGAPTAFAAPIDEGSRTRSSLELGADRAWSGGNLSLLARWTPTGPVEATELRMTLSRAF